MLSDLQILMDFGLQIFFFQNNNKTWLLNCKTILTWYSQQIPDLFIVNFQIANLGTKVMAKIAGDFQAIKKSLYKKWTRTDT